MQLLFALPLPTIQTVLGILAVLDSRLTHLSFALLFMLVKDIPWSCLGHMSFYRPWE
jgi:hypothetical protein